MIGDAIRNLQQEFVKAGLEPPDITVKDHLQLAHLSNVLAHEVNVAHSLVEGSAGYPPYINFSGTIIRVNRIY